MKFHFTSSDNKEAIKAKNALAEQYGQFIPKESDVIVPVGGDGFLLKCLQEQPFL